MLELKLLGLFLVRALAKCQGAQKLKKKLCCIILGFMILIIVIVIRYLIET